MATVRCTLCLGTFEELCPGEDLCWQGLRYVEASLKQARAEKERNNSGPPQPKVQTEYHGWDRLYSNQIPKID